MSSFTVNGVTVTPILNSSFGAEVSGIDWKHVPLPDNIIKTVCGTPLLLLLGEYQTTNNHSPKQLITLQNKYAVIIFRQTGLDNDRHVAFSKQLGNLEVNPAWGNTQRVDNTYLFDVSNLEADGSIAKKGSRRWAHSLGNALWHTDSSFNQHRAKYSLLLAHSVPGAGKGKTEFADTRQAFRDLNGGQKAELRDIVVEHEYTSLLPYERPLCGASMYTELS